LTNNEKKIEYERLDRTKVIVVTKQANSK